MTPRKKSKEGPRNERLPEARYYPHEAELVRSVSGHSVSEFIRNAVLKEAKRVQAKSKS